MKKIIYSVFVMAILTSIMACGNSKVKNSESIEQTDSVQTITVDEVLSNADSWVGHEVAVVGFCTHACKHGATKIFLMGSADSVSIRVDAGDLGSFDTQCVNEKVKVKGVLIEDRIDEAYLQNWEKKNALQVEKEHGEGKGEGCDTEKKSRGEKANSVAERIHDFRVKIEARKNEFGKDYLSFYHIEASDYEIQ